MPSGPKRRGHYPQTRKPRMELSWLIRPARRICRRPRGALSWQQAVISLQKRLQVPAVVVVDYVFPMP